MPKTINKANGFSVEEKRTYFNFNKLQAALCIATSAAISVALIIWAVNSLV
jgi:hypothetical protein